MERLYRQGATTLSITTLTLTALRNERQSEKQQCWYNECWFYGYTVSCSFAQVGSGLADQYQNRVKTLAYC